ncbi:DUF6188 family protein [Thermomonas aquatica]|uniref:Uncharacterized protein n=1 Tax=Thermomonas aquatica TaxID=2202149 RepID=A0A5B7ZNH2_9GAMM|nr:DUF6188 family protein [Thermomonas aquatica]QDA56508.1 hypothetical protein FHQ07_03855 [Thermomonas aquatica]
MKPIGKLAGKQLNSVESWEGCPCVMQFEDNYKLYIESLWRLGNNKSLLLTSEDDRQTYGLEAAIDAIAQLRERLQSQRVSHAIANELTGDLTLIFSPSNLRFEVISSSTGFEAWQIYKGTDIRYVAVGGGQIKEWP